MVRFLRFGLSAGIDDLVYVVLTIRMNRIVWLLPLVALCVACKPKQTHVAQGATVYHAAPSVTSSIVHRFGSASSMGPRLGYTCMRTFGG